MISEITVGRWDLVVRVQREALIVNGAIGDLTGASVRKRLIDKIGVEETLYPWKRHIIEAFEYAPVIVNGKTTGDEIWTIRINQLENPVPVVAILGGIAAIVIVGLVYLTVEDLKPVIEQAPLLVGGIGLGIVALILLPVIVWAWSKFSRSS